MSPQRPRLGGKRAVRRLTRVSCFLCVVISSGLRAFVALCVFTSSRVVDFYFIGKVFFCGVCFRFGGLEERVEGGEGGEVQS